MNCPTSTAIKQDEKPGLSTPLSLGQGLAWCVSCVPALFLLVALLWVLSAAFVSFYNWDRQYADVAAYFDAGKRLVAGLPLYSSYGSVGAPEKLFLYPPTFAAFMVPFTWFNPLWGHAVWMALHVVTWISVGKLLCRSLPLSTLRQIQICFAGVFLFLIAPFNSELNEGQVNSFVVALVLFGLVFREERRIPLASFFFAVSLHMKLQTGVFILAFLLRRDWRMCGWTVGWGILLCLAPFFFVPQNALMAGVGYYQAFFETILGPTLSQGTIAGRQEFFIQNNSLSAVAHRFFSDTAFSPFAAFQSIRGPLFFEISSAALRMLSSLLGVTLVAISLGVSRLPAAKFETTCLSAGVLLLAVQLASPTCWEHHLVSLVLVFAPLLSMAINKRINRGALYAVCAPFFLALSAPFLVSFTNHGALALHYSRMYGLPTLGLLVLWGFSVRCILRDGRSTAAG